MSEMSDFLAGGCSSAIHKFFFFPRALPGSQFDGGSGGLRKNASTAEPLYIYLTDLTFLTVSLLSH
jgi:hypothetical protein